MGGNWDHVALGKCYQFDLLHIIIVGLRHLKYKQTYIEYNIMSSLLYITLLQSLKRMC